MDQRRSANNFSRSSNGSSNRSSFREQQTRPWPNVPTHQIMPTTVALPPVTNELRPTSISNDISRQVANLTVTPPRPVAQSSPTPVTPVSPPAPTQNSPRSSSNLEVGVVPTLK